MIRPQPAFLLLFTVLFAGIASAGVPASGANNVRIVDRLEDGRAAALSFEGSSPDTPQEVFARQAELLFGTVMAPDLRLWHQSQSLTGSHLSFQQFVDGEAVIDGGVAVDADSAGVIRSLSNSTARGVPPPLRIGASEAEERILPEGAALERAGVRSVLVNDHGMVRRAWRIERRLGSIPFLWYVDGENGRVIRRESEALDAGGRVFVQNPVETLNDPTLQDHDNAASAIPDSAYSLVDLPDLSSSGPLRGPNVMIAELEVPTVPLADSALALTFDRSQSGFEEVMAYYHVDRMQRYLQSIGYSGQRRIVPYAIKVDPHAANGQDNSFFVPTAFGVGELHFGDGGVDDAEDPDIIAHEYGHAIQESIAPSTFGGDFAGQTRALGEGFGDYWAFSSSYGPDLESGHDPFCIGDWDSHCADASSTNCGYPPGAQCLRRVDGTKTMDDYIFTDTRGTEHLNGEIWSSALREIHLGMVGRKGLDAGRPEADRVILESTFGAPPLPQFRTLATRMIEADRILNGGQNRDLICQAFILRKILDQTDCDLTPHGDLVEIQSTDRDLPIPDNSPGGVLSRRVVSDIGVIDETLVKVEIAHPFRGDLKIVLMAPDGRSVLLQSSSRSPGVDIKVTYGLDAVPTESLDLFNGMSAAGTWTLQVIDSNPPDVGRLVSWSLIFKLAGQGPITIRPATVDHLVIPVVASTRGDAGTEFHSDVRIYNRSPSRQEATLFFTPSAADGTASFSAQRLQIDPGQTVAFDDIVTAEFRTAGTGSLEIRGTPAALVASSRTFDQTGRGTYGQFIPAEADSAAFGAEDGAVTIPQLLNTESFRTNVGVTEIAGTGGDAGVDFYDASGTLIDSRTLTLPPWGHLQFSAFGGRGGMVVEAARAAVTVRSPGMRVLAYASVIDNLSGDPIYVPAVSNPLWSDQILPVVFRGDGDRDTHWRSDLALTNPSEVEQPFSLELRTSAGEVQANSGPMSVAAGGSLFISDVLRNQFSIDAGSGSLLVRRATAPYEAPGPLLVTSRSWTDSDSGTFGQFIAGRRGQEGIASGESVSAIQLESSADFRTNVGASETSGAPTVVRITIADAGGRAIFSTDLLVPARGQVQFNLSKAGCPDFSDGRARFEVISGEGRLLPFASVIDNRTGDPIYIEGR
jgi:subtilisin-like proprotein convertase family protein